jgi:hypothetical protein
MVEVVDLAELGVNQKVVMLVFMVAEAAVYTLVVVLALLEPPWRRRAA